MLEPDNANQFVVIWMCCVGAAFGSFMNVVVYRLPLGISLIDPPSHCPKCKHLIRWYDNVPVFGWIMRRGRCRHCDNPISIRYPVVEAIVALLFGMVTSYEFLTEGINLPPRLVGLTTGLNTAQSYGVCLYHLLLLCTLLCTALIEIDGQRPPIKLFLPAWLVGFIAPLTSLWLRPVPAFSGVPDAMAGAVDGLVGLCVGAAIGGIIWRAAHQQHKQMGMLLGLSSVGLFLGWQAVSVLAVAAMAVYFVNCILRHIVPKFSQIPATVWLLVSTLIWILFWFRIVPCLPF